MMNSAGNDPSEVMQGRIINVNLVKWTVDVFTTFDRKRYLDIPVSSPYMHYNNGEGFSVVPEVGAVCEICVPSDSSGPFVLAFIMPHEVVDGATEDAPNGTRSHGTPQGASDASFAGNRPVPKPGDMYLRGRDGNFLILHRGGVLQIGATELAQRIYVPLGNLIVDISEQYAHHNPGGSITWGLQDGPSQEKFPTQYQHMFRVFANDKYADVKLAIGKVYNPVPEPDGGVAMGASEVGQGEDNPILFELCVSPQGFDAENGDLANPGVAKQTVIHMMFDRKGNLAGRIEGNVALIIKKKLSLVVHDDISIVGKKSFSLDVTNGVQINGGSSTHIKGKVVRLGPGNTPVALLNGLVTSFITAMPCVFIYTGEKPTPLVPGTPNAGILSIGPGPTGMPALGIGGNIKSASETVLA